MLECRAAKKRDALPTVPSHSNHCMSARAFILVAVLAGLSCPGAHALGIVRSPETIALGATLNFAVTVQVAPEETLTTTCVAADVMQGDQHVQPSTVRVAIEPVSTPEERL